MIDLIYYDTQQKGGGGCQTEKTPQAIKKISTVFHLESLLGHRNLILLVIHQSPGHRQICLSKLQERHGKTNPSRRNVV